MPTIICLGCDKKWDLDKAAASERAQLKANRCPDCGTASLDRARMRVIEGYSHAASARDIRGLGSKR
jgi:DNA-directed RNA polymerase subunit RPC12/RpoP